ncbi:MAG: hypothetical protein R3F56_08170 [Planctomycetota bacterium]
MTVTEATRRPIGAYVGVALGVSGWALGLVLGCAVAGEVHLALTVGLPCLLGSLCLATLAILAWERYRPTPRVLVGWGLLLFSLLAAAVSYWVLPAVMQSDRVRDVLARTRSSTELPWPTLAATALAGLTCILWPTRRVTPP